MKRIGKAKDCEKHYERIWSIGYSQHDSESWYRCPNCKKEFGSWGLLNKGINSGDVFECDCGEILFYH